MKWTNLSIAVFLIAVTSLCPSTPAQRSNNASPTASRNSSAPAGNQLDSDVKQLNFEDLEKTVLALTPGPERDYFMGIFANRTGHIDQSIQLLESALPQIRATRSDRAAQALESLTDDYVKAYRYSDAIAAYDDLLSHFSAQLAPTELQETRDDYGVAKLLRAAPPQTVTWNGPARLKTERDPLGALNLRLTVNGVTAPWMLDTGANFSVVSASFAKRIGLQPLEGSAQTMSGVTGIENPLHVAILPEMQIGGVTVRNVVFLILDNANLSLPIGKTSYTIHAIVGYPVIQALGAVTFTRDGELQVGLSDNQTGPSSRLFMNKLTPLLECVVQGKTLLFAFDTGANASQFSVRYFQDFAAEISLWKKVMNQSAGAGGVKKTLAYEIPYIVLRIAEQKVDLHRVTILPASVGTDFDQTYGNLGRDVVAAFDSFTLDFVHMTFTLGKPAPPSSN